MIELQITEAKKGSRPNVSMPHRGIYGFLQEEGIRKLVGAHYDLLRESSIAHLFPQESAMFEAAKRNSADFFVQIMGGKQYYNENRGAPMLVRRHQPFHIDANARKVWLGFYRQLLPELGLPDELLTSFWNYLDQFSIWMINAD
jgi:hemoglobin